MEKEMSSIYTIADKLRTPGIKIRDVVIAPDEITKRLKMSVQRMLRKGATQGSWSSKAKRIAVALNDTYSLGLISKYHSCSLYVPAGVSDAGIEQLCGLVEANLLLELMSDAERSLPEYVERHQKQTRERHALRIERLKAGDQVYLPFQTVELADEAVALCVTVRTQEQIDKSEALCRDLEAGNEIAITINI
jgi:hypothetical protein